MDLIGDALRYVADNPDRFRRELLAHLRLSVSALLIAVAIFVPLGVLVSRSNRIGPALVGAIGAIRVVPSLAVLFLLFPIMGPGFEPALVALTLLAGPPLIINTDAGLRNVSAAVTESARGLGMTPRQVFARVEFPLALPVVVAGVRSASVEVVSSAALAALVGAEGLGRFIVSGLTSSNYPLLLVGAIPVTLLALLAEVALGGAERCLAPPVA